MPMVTSGYEAAAEMLRIIEGCTMAVAGFRQNRRVVVSGEFGRP